MNKFETLKQEILTCQACCDILAYKPRPVFQGQQNSKIMQISQAPSRKVMETGLPFNDPSGEKLRNDWYQITSKEFYDSNNFYITSIGRWKNKEDIKDARIDTVLSIGLGGIVSMCIVIVAATNCGGLQIKSGGDLAMALQPVLGNGATVLVSIGLFAAGLTSTITAPLATAYATSGILGISQDMKTKKFQIIWLIVIVSGMIFLAFNHSSPTQLILIAQGANAIILPIMAIFLMICMNDEKLEEYKNGKLNNIMGFIVLGVTILICIRNIMSMMG